MINRIPKFSGYWNQLSITIKFSLAFILMLFLVLFIAGTSFITLRIVINQINSTIINSTEIRKLVLTMDGSMEEARRLQGDYFLHFSTFLYQTDEKTLGDAVRNQIDYTIEISRQLKKMMETSDVSNALRRSKININFYLSAAHQYKKTFEEAVFLISKLTEPKYGLKQQLSNISNEMHQIVVNFGDRQLTDLFHDMLLLEKDYWIARKRYIMQSAYNELFEFDNRISVLKKQDNKQFQKLELLIEQYRSITNQILDLDVLIISRFNEFELQIKALDPISNELILLANKEVEDARNEIRETNRIAIIILSLVAFLGLFVTALIAYVINKSITKNIVRLTDAAGSIKAGQLNSTIEIETGDELGKLAQTFNSMSGQLDSMVSDLENKVIIRTKNLEEAKVEAEQANNAKSEFLANISHELRNPMHHILSYSKFGVDRFTSVKQDKLLHFFRQILKSATRLMLLLNDLLDLSKMEAGKMEYDFEDWNVCEIVKEAVDELKQAMKDKKIQYTLENCSNSLNAKCDHFKIGQVIRNLMTNAIKFTPEGKEIQIQVLEKIIDNGSDNGRNIEISIKDEGVGIPEDEIQKIFDKFTQSSKTKTGAGGTGLGLAISYEIIKAHKGNIWAENNPDQGSTFKFIIPADL
jgi:signal transduction histidine kinase